MPSSENCFNDGFPEHTIDYMPGPYQGWILPVVDLQYQKKLLYYSVKVLKPKIIANMHMWDPNIHVKELPKNFCYYKYK